MNSKSTRKIVRALWLPLLKFAMDLQPAPPKKARTINSLAFTAMPNSKRGLTEIVINFLVNWPRIGQHLSVKAAKNLIRG